ncbi:GAF domain-containing protein [Rhodococcus sp. G-MC3]|uniref:helix-turn-helix domain-containing protein n=1 Tax=Rhodococcus sp. G-MC3 TaxID=3046209 RepID=UPI0024BA5DD5|nr:GAF domain-containing protein [Rhodococcus sp. G-MC3]MDJ0395343.1 GAF domain-containing protein [Rhodococcus sp. G-MC3]
MQLLLDEASVEDLEAHRLSVPDDVDDAHAALRLRAQLDQRRQRSSELAALNDIAVRLTTVRDDRSLLQEVVDQARRLLGVDLAYIGSAYGNYFVIEVTSGALTPQLVGLRLARDQGLVGLVIRSSAPAWTHDYQNEPAFLHITGADSAARSENMRGLLGVPLRVGERVIGALFACKRQERDFTESEIALLSALAAHAAVAIENVRAIERLESLNAELSTRTAELEKTLQWDRTLTQVVLSGGGVQRLIREVATLSGKKVRFLNAQDVPDDEDAASVVQRCRAGSDTAASDTVIGHRVAAAGQFLGTLIAYGDDSETRLLLDRAAPALALSLAEERAASEAARRAQDAFLVDLLTHPASTPDDERRQLRLAGLTSEKSYCIAVVLGSTRAAIPTSAGTVVAEHGSRILVAVPARDSSAARSVFLSGTVGISEPARGSEALAKAYLEAQQTVDVLTTLGRVGDVSSARGLGIYRILLSHLAREHLDELSEEQLGPLMAEQNKRGVPLLDTLSVYLAHGRHHSATASSLGVHVNTLYQRLDAIDRLIGKDWRDPDKALDLQVLMRLRRSADLLGK